MTDKMTQRSHKMTQRSHKMTQRSQCRLQLAPWKMEPTGGARGAWRLWSREKSNTILKMRKRRTTCPPAPASPHAPPPRPQHCSDAALQRHSTAAVQHRRRLGGWAGLDREGELVVVAHHLSRVARRPHHPRVHRRKHRRALRHRPPPPSARLRAQARGAREILGRIHRDGGYSRGTGREP